MAKIKDNGWTTIQEANSKKHIKEINCRAEDGMVVEVSLRHSQGELVKTEVMFGGQKALPMAIKEFQKHFDNDEFNIIEK